MIKNGLSVKKFQHRKNGVNGPPCIHYPLILLYLLPLHSFPHLYPNSCWIISKQIPDVTSVRALILPLADDDLLLFFPHNHYHNKKFNNDSIISSDTQSLFKFSQLSHKCLFTTGLFQSGSKQDPYIEFG